jgi:hypothetical protein
VREKDERVVTIIAGISTALQDDLPYSVPIILVRYFIRVKCAHTDSLLTVFVIDAWYGKPKKQNVLLLSAASFIYVQQITFKYGSP